MANFHSCKLITLSLLCAGVILIFASTLYSHLVERVKRIMEPYRLNTFSNYYMLLDLSSINGVKDIGKVENYPAEHVISYLGEDVSLLCVTEVKEVNSSFDPVAWKYSHNNNNKWLSGKSTWSSCTQNCTSQLNIVAVTKKDFGIYFCINRITKRIVKVFDLFEFEPEAVQMYLPPGSLVNISVAIHWLTSSNYSDKLKSGVVINGKDQGEFRNSLSRCSKHLHVSIDYKNLDGSPFVLLNNQESDTTSLDPQHLDETSMSCLNRFAKLTTNLNFCTDRYHYGVFQIYFEKVNISESQRLEIVRIFYPVSFVIKPILSFDGWFFHKMDKEIQDYDLNQSEFLKKEMHVEFTRNYGSGKSVASDLDEQTWFWHKLFHVLNAFLILLLLLMVYQMYVLFKFLYYTLNSETQLYHEENSRIYVLFSYDDRADMRKNIRLLEQIGIKIWFSLQDEIPGYNKMEQNLEAIRRSSKYLVFLTTHLDKLEHYYLGIIQYMIAVKEISARDTMIIFEKCTEEKVRDFRWFKGIALVPYEDTLHTSWPNKLSSWAKRKTGKPPK